MIGAGGSIGRIMSREGHVAATRHTAASAQREGPTMSYPTVLHRAEHDFLRAVYELTDYTAKKPICFVEAQRECGYSAAEADEACDFWADRGVLEFPDFDQVALTHLGLRRANRLAERGWQIDLRF
jgi:hypothetical protein